MTCKILNLCCKIQEWKLGITLEFYTKFVDYQLRNYSTKDHVITRLHIFQMK